MILGSKIGTTMATRDSNIKYVDYIRPWDEYCEDFFDLTYDTPISSRSFVAEIKWLPLSNQNDRFIFGGGQNSQPPCCIGIDSGSANKNPTPISMPDGNIAVIFTANATVTQILDGEYCVCETNPMRSDVGIYLFAQEWYWWRYGPIFARLHRATFYNEDKSAILMDLFPVKTLSGGALYDKINGKFYESSMQMFITNEED